DYAGPGSNAVCARLTDHEIASFSLNAPATTQLYTLSLHDALPISSPTSRASRRASSTSSRASASTSPATSGRTRWRAASDTVLRDRKSTRLNSSHVKISYAVFCLKKKNKKQTTQNLTAADHTHTDS